MSKKNYLIIGAIALITIFATLIKLPGSNQVTETQKPNISINPSNQNPSAVTKPSSKPDSINQSTGISVDLTEIKSDINITPLKTTDIQNSSPKTQIEVAKYGDVICQPKNFDPKIRQFEKISDPNLIPADFYETTDDLDFGRFSISEPSSLKLPEPLKITQYDFKCGSIQDSVLDIQANDTRIYLFQDVKKILSQKQISKNGKFLYLDFYSLVDQNYIEKKVIVDLISQKLIDLNSFNCSDNAFWGSENLIGFSESKNPLNFNISESNAQNVDICIFDQNGSLKDSFRYKTISQTSSGNLYTDIKLDSIDDYLSLYSGSVLSNGPQSCILSVYNLKTKTLKEAVIAQADQSGTCPTIDILKLQDNRAVLNIE